MDVKPIETVYQGYKFRSRLEARWAVFFDKLNIEWQYEAEGYRLKDGTFYLPDFFLPKLDCFIEIKGQDATQLEKNKAKSLSSFKPVVIFAGNPGEKSGLVYLFDSTDGGGGEGWWEVEFALGLYHGWQLTTWNGNADRVYSTYDTYDHVTIKTGCDDMFIPLLNTGEGVVAVNAAKQARFEHNGR